MPCFSCACFSEGTGRNGERLNGGRGYCELYDQEYWRGHECGSYAPVWYAPETSGSALEEPRDYSLFDADDTERADVETAEIFGNTENTEVPVSADTSVETAEEIIEGASDKSWRTTLLLAIFLGQLGVHRFYVGKIGSGVLFWLTCGWFGIGSIVDIILILSGKFTDKTGAPVLRKRK